MKKVIATAVLLGLGSGLAATSRADDPKYKIELKARDACATPKVVHQATADSGTIDVKTTSDDTMAVRMSGAAYAISYLGHTSTASETLHLVQEFEVTCADPKVSEVVLTLESSLVGTVTTARKADAGMRLARVAVVPCGWPSTPLELAHPPLCADRGGSRQCNLQLPSVQGPPMPLGRYTLTADFVVDASAGGICNARGSATFGADAKPPADWTAAKDPFSNSDKAGSGFFAIVRASTPPSAQGTAATPGPAPIPGPPPSGLPSPLGMASGPARPRVGVR